MKEIQLTQNKVVQVDDSDFDWLNQWSWYAYKGRHTYYAVRHDPKNHNNLIRMHRLIMNTPDDKDVDHQDLNGLNCQRYNMRNCTNQQNGTNRTPCGRSKYLGVSYLRGKYNDYIKAQIRVNNEVFSLGYCKTEEQAAKRYDGAALFFHGEFANPNFITI